MFGGPLTFKVKTEAYTKCEDGISPNTETDAPHIPNRYSVILNQRVPSEITYREEYPKSFFGKKDFSDFSSPEPDSNPGTSAEPEETDNDPGEPEGQKEQNNLPGDVRFPKLTGSPDWVAAVKNYDLKHAELFARIFPKEPSPLVSGDIARKYYRKRRTGALSDVDAMFLERW